MFHRAHSMLVALALLLAALSAPLQAAETTPAAKATTTTSELLKDLPAGTYALFQTNHGEFLAQLFTDKAPQTTANFIGLAEGTKAFLNPKTNAEEKKPYYDGLIFHRVIKGFMLQGGDPEGSGSGGPGFMIKDEFGPGLKHDKAGILSMANAGPDTGGSQFFITVAATPWLDGKHAIFGEIVRGLDQVLAISELPTGANDRPQQPVVMEHVTIHRIEAKAEAPAAK